MVSRDSICAFIESLYRDFDTFGCCIESPNTEPDVCYTSTNLLAEYVFRNVCGRTELANKIREFLNRYPTDFYDYYQILLLKPFTLPFTVVEHVQVDVIDSIRVVHVKRTNIVVDNYYNYANLLAYKAIYHIFYGERDKAIAELGRLNGLFDGYGFADEYYRVHNKYEAYKIALAIIPHKALGYTEEVDRYTNIILSIDPFTTLYTVTDGRLTGVGDLNLETASLTAMALYSTVWHDILPKVSPVIETKPAIDINIINILTYITGVIVIIHLVRYIRSMIR